MWCPIKETNAKLSLGIFISLCKTVFYLEPCPGKTQTVCHYHPVDSCCFIGCGAATLSSPTGPWMLTGLCYCQSLDMEVPPKGPSKADGVLSKLLENWVKQAVPSPEVKAICQTTRLPLIGCCKQIQRRAYVCKSWTWQLEQADRDYWIDFTLIEKEVRRVNTMPE